jgi:hypothetical protein
MGYTYMLGFSRRLLTHYCLVYCYVEYNEYDLPLVSLMFNYICGKSCVSPHVV